MFFIQTTQNLKVSFFGCCFSLGVLLCALTSKVYAEETAIEPMTKVYKVVAEDGSVSFSDQANAQSETILVPPVATVPAINPNTAQTAPPIKNDQSALGSYTSLSILAPSNESAFYSASGDVDVIVDVKPALLREDTLAFYLDNTLITTDRQLQVRLPAVERGMHELKVKLLDANGNTLKESTSVFTVHKPSIRN